MALPVNIEDIIHQRVVENARIEYKADWNPKRSARKVQFDRTEIPARRGTICDGWETYTCDMDTRR